MVARGGGEEEGMGGWVRGGGWGSELHPVARSE